MNQEKTVEASILTPEQVAPAKDPLSWSGPVERNMVKEYINRISHTSRSRKEKDAWDAIIREEKQEDRVAAVTHTLLDRADKWGRKALVYNKIVLGTEVAKLHDKQKGESKGILEETTKRKQQAQAHAKREMARIQEELVKAERDIETASMASLDTIRTKFQPRLDDAAARLLDVGKVVTSETAAFAEALKGLALEQLEILATGGQVTRVKEGTEMTITLPGTHKKERLLAGEK